MKRTDFAPLLHLKRVSDASLGPFVLLNHASDQVYELVVIDKTVGRIYCIGQISQLEDLRRGASEDEVSVEDHFLFLYAADYVNVSVGNDDRLGIVGQVVQVVELLYLIGFVLEVEQVAVGFFNREDGDFFDGAREIGRLGDCNAALVGLNGPCKVLSGYGITENLGEFDQNAIIDPNRGALRDRLKLIGSICKLIFQEFDLLVELFAQVLPDHLVIGNIPKVVVRGERLHLLLELDQPLDVLIQARVLLEVHFPHIDELKADLREKLLHNLEGFFFHEADLVQLLLEFLGMKLAVVFFLVDVVFLLALDSEFLDPCQHVVGHLLHLPDRLLQLQDAMPFACVLLRMEHGTLKAEKFVALEASGLHLAVAARRITPSAILHHS